MSVMDALRQATRPQHERLHEVVSLDAMTQDRDAYAEMLQRYLAAVRPSEAEARDYLANFPTATEMDWNQRLQKRDWLVADLKALGCEGQFKTPEERSGEACRASAESGDLPQIVARFLGTVYVMEGMTLGADRMVGLISERLNVSADSGARFFTGYGRDNASMWKQFRAWGAEQDVAADLAAETACNIFARFERCLSGQARTGECV